MAIRASIITTGCGTIRVLSRKSDYLQQENSYGHRVMASQQALQDRILKEIIDRIPQREVSAPYIKMATAIGIFMNWL